MEQLIGIAKMAAEAVPLEAKKKVEYREIQARSYVARVKNERMPFQWGINPYRGCEFGCKYCYARYTHEFMELHHTEQFETEIFAKNFAPSRLREELRALPLNDSIVMGTATDPYQPAERRFQVTRKMLEVFAGTAGFRLGITTKSDLIVRDLDLLREINRRHKLLIAMTITTIDSHLARLLEPMAPRPDLRLAAIRKLTIAGIQVRISCAPVIPMITDTEENLEAVIRAGVDAGVRDVWGGVLFLSASAQAAFFPFLEKQYPHLVTRYRERFAHGAYLRGDYPQQIEKRINDLRSRHGLPVPKPQALPEFWPKENQYGLF